MSGMRWEPVEPVLIGANSTPIEGGSYPLSSAMRAFLLATSPVQRARLMLPRGVLSGLEFPVTSINVAAASSTESCDFGRRVRRAIKWNGASASFQSRLAFSIQKFGS